MGSAGAFASTAEKYIAAKNALVAKYTFELLAEDEQQKVDSRIRDVLVSAGVPENKAESCKSILRETQYYGMAAVAMAVMGIRPGLANVLFKDRWESVENPLVALTGAEKEIEMASNQIRQKHRIKLSLNDDDKQHSGWKLLLKEHKGRKNLN